MINKKGVVTYTYIIGAVLLVLVIFFLVSKGALASKSMTSAIAKKDGCNSPNIPVAIKGTGYTQDTAYLGVIAEPQKVTIDEVKASGVSLRAISNQDYTWTAKLYDSYSGNLVASDGGDNTHPGGKILTADKYSLAFTIPDNNCDDRVDDFEGYVVYDVRTEDGEESSVQQKVSFSNGRLIR